MSTSLILNRLYSLDSSSLDFSRHLFCLIQHDEEDQYLTNLQGPELARLVDFLDEVRTLSSTFCLIANRTLQALSAISANDDLSRQCLDKLQAICSRRAILPSSYIASGQIDRVGNAPISLGAIADVWEGTYVEVWEGPYPDVWKGTYPNLWEDSYPDFSESGYFKKQVSIKRLNAPSNDDQILRKVCIQRCMSSSRLLKNACGSRSHSSKRPLYGKS